MRTKSTAQETIELRNEILKYIVEHKEKFGGDSPAIQDIGDAFEIAKSTAKYHLDALHRSGKIEIISLSERKTAIKVVFPPTIDGVTDLGSAKMFDFGTGRAWIGDGGRVIFEVHHCYLKSPRQFREFIDSLIAAQDRIEKGTD